jgi:hypothetical protein
MEDCMTKNVTLRLDEAVLRQARHAAVERDQSLSEWVAGLITRATSETERKQSARAGALRRMAKGLHLGGAPLSREEAHGR